MAGHIASAKNENWCTPLDLVARVHRALGGPPDLDPCSNPKSVVGARRAISRPDDGLSSDWSLARTIFCNPPFGAGIDRWVGRCVGAWRDHQASVVLLVPAAVDTRYWQDHVATADRVCFLRGRVRFQGAPACAPFATAIALWVGPGGADRRSLLHRFDQAFGDAGTIWSRRGTAP